MTYIDNKIAGWKTIYGNYVAVAPNMADDALGWCVERFGCPESFEPGEKRPWHAIEDHRWWLWSGHRKVNAIHFFFRSTLVAVEFKLLFG